MTQKQVENISAAKAAAEHGARIIGHSPQGGIRVIDGKTFALKHPNHRFTDDVANRWGHPDDGYAQADLVPIHMHLDPQPINETVRAVDRWLAQMQEGKMPDDATQGVEIEGVVYKNGTSQLAPAFKDPSQNHHPELMETTLETATGKKEDDSYPNTSVSLARELAKAVLTANEQAAQDGNCVVHSSVPEGGSLQDNKNTPIPYLEAFAPRVLADTILHGKDIPKEVRELYAQMGVPQIEQYLQESGILNWPVNALHVHNGVPMIGEMADPRAAFAMAEIRNTELAKIASFMLYNTQYCYGTDTGLADVRSIARKLLSTTHGGAMPNSTEEYIRNATSALETGTIHSLARYPAESQHDRTRIRFDGVTMESIDAPMNPDLRLVLGWTSINQVVNVIALDALHETKGDESLVAEVLQKKLGPLLRKIPAMGNASCYEHDLLFNTEGYDAKPQWMDDTYIESIKAVVSMFETYGNKYPALKTSVAIAKETLMKSIQKNEVSLEEFFGIETGTYNPNGYNKGIVTQAKKGLPIEELIRIQSSATILQAEALSQIQNDEELLAFFGIS